MSLAADCSRERSGSHYGAFAYASVILSCYAGFFYNERYYAPLWTVPCVFLLGAIYAAVGVLGDDYIEHGERKRLAIYFLIQCALVTAIIWVSPIRGFMGIIVLPVVSEAVFELRTRNAVLVILYLFGVNIALWAEPYGWSGASEAVISYLAGFAFTVAFTIITKQALNARKRETALRQEVERANQQLRDHAAQAEELATTRERNRLAREIHDGVGHYLTVVKTQLDVAVALMPTQPAQAITAVGKAAKLAADALDDVRRSVGALRTDTARPPLPEALRALTQEAGLPVTVRVEGEARALSPGIEHALFRSAQEGLTNIRKHAAASAAEVALDFRPIGRVKLAVIDNGRGIDRATGLDREGGVDRGASGGASADGGANGVGGFGLIGIRERIEVLGGCVESGNRADGGFALTIEVPA